MLVTTALALLLALPQDSAQVRASLSQDRIAAGGTTVLSIQVETSGATPDEIPVPVLPPGLDLGPVSDFSQLQVAFPGGQRRVTRREVVIMASARGVYRIPAIAIRLAGHTLQTRALQLVVGPPQRALDEMGSPAGVTLRAWASPATVFVGEQVLYQIEAVFPEELRLRQARAPNFEPPVAAGFWTYDLPEPVAVSLRMTAAEAAEVQSFRQVLFPLAEGILTIPPARLQYEIRQGIVFTPEVHALATVPVPVRVLPLPPGAPPGFAGAVGSYNVTSALSSGRAAPGEPVTLRITIEGSGNIKALTRPALDSIPGIDTYQGAEHVETGFGNGVVSGRRVFEWTLVPRTGGLLTVPGLAYTWFEPRSRSYRVARTAALHLKVSGSSSIAPLAQALAPLRTRPAPDRAGWATTPAFAILQLLPPIGLAALWLGRRRRSRRSAQPARYQAPELQRAAALVVNPRACLEQLAHWLAAREATPAVTRLHERVRRALYSPDPPTGEQCAELIRAARALNEASREITSGRGPAALLVLALTVAPAATGEEQFGRGVAAYDAGAYQQAADAFAAFAAAHARDPHGWYDLGNGAYRAGQPGRATWAWLKALELDPRDSWTNHNLLLTGDQEAARAFAPRVPLADAEAAMLAALLWWLAAGALALAVKSGQRRRRTAAAGGTLLLLMLPLAALLLARTARPDRAVTLAPVPLQSAPSLRAETVRVLPPGAALVVRAHRKEWLLVRARDLREGWLEARSVGRL